MGPFVPSSGAASICPPLHLSMLHDARLALKVAPPSWIPPVPHQHNCNMHLGMDFAKVKCSTDHSQVGHKKLSWAQAKMSHFAACDFEKEVFRRGTLKLVQKRSTPGISPPLPPTTQEGNCPEKQPCVWAQPALPHPSLSLLPVGVRLAVTAQPQCCLLHTGERSQGHA